MKWNKKNGLAVESQKKIELKAYAKCNDTKKVNELEAERARARKKSP